jgi:acetolactate synthase-1/2/3 large subunit
MVRQWQTLFYGKRYSQTVLNDKVDYVKVSEGLGVDAVRVTKPEEFRPALEKALASGKPYVIDCVIDPDDKVSPIIPAGKPNDDIYDQKDMANWKG